MSFYVIIPARYGSSRLPGKPLLDISGKPLIQHVYECAIKSAASDVIIATDDERINEAAKNMGARVCMTRKDHLSGTDRLAEVVNQLRLNEDDIVVNLQGDEPLMPAVLLEQVAETLDNATIASISTLCEPISSEKDIFDPDIVKVVVEHSGHALFFSRAPIPWVRDTFSSNSPKLQDPVENCFRHIGLYAYRAGFLKKFPNLQRCQLEQQEALEQLRALYYGYRIKVDIAKEPAGIGVDTPLDLQQVRQLI